MNQEETQLKQLLERSRQQLTRPFSNVQRRLLYLINIAYLTLTPLFLISEKVATGTYVPDNKLWSVFGFVWLANLVSGIYAYLSPRQSQLTIFGNQLDFSQRKYTIRFEQALRWTSVLSVMLMSLTNMIGIGNPATGSLLADFALAHSLIILSVMILGRRVMLAWSVIVVLVLAYITFGQLGYSYQFQYLTPGESARYERAIAQKQPWALNRQAVLKASHLNPPRASGYFNTWMIFILVATATAYFFAGVALDLFKIIPEVTDDIKEAIDATKLAEQYRVSDLSG